MRQAFPGHAPNAVFRLIQQRQNPAGIVIQGLPLCRGQQALFFAQKKPNAKISLQLQNARGNTGGHPVQNFCGVADAALFHYRQECSEVCDFHLFTIDDVYFHFYSFAMTIIIP